ncbi:hypothetical protein FS837_001084 [Tulasnella sp. UAMH 9824]|nr:hypothetical protein FS837_001084 [Tulasnella sp. UAMH 9824]
MTHTPKMRYTGQAASVSSTLKHKPSSSSRVDTPSTLVVQLSSHDLSGSYAKDEKTLLNISGRSSPQSSGLKRQAAVRPETPRNMLVTESRSAGIRKMPLPSQHSTTSSFENYSPKSRSGRIQGPVGYVPRQAGATKSPAVPPANALNLDMQGARQSKPLPAIEPGKLSPPRAVFTDVLSASPSSMATTELPVYSSDEEWSKRVPPTQPRRREGRTRTRTRTPSFGSRRQGVIGELHPDSSSSESDTESIGKSQGSVSSGHSASTDNRTSRYARLLVAIGI